MTTAEAQKGVIQDLYEAAKTESEGFNCESSETTNESVMSFSDTVQQQVDAINAYKTAVKNLIAAIKTAATAAGVN